MKNILAQARAGATSHAWSAFCEAGLQELTGDPGVLTLKGRLLKDLARRAAGDAASRLYLQSAKAYADAAALRPDSYPLINAATMSLFAGQPGHMELLAQKVLTMLDSGIGIGETAYWHEATRAEALLLLSRPAEAHAALGTAIVAAPAAWEDRAATLRQFRQILNFRREAADWLAGYAPPASIYFQGMIGIAPDDLRAAEIARDAVRDSKAGFGYGALAAGADILIAEGLAERGAELHVVLPVIPAAFRKQSVAPYGDGWLPRFDRLLERAASVTIAAAGDVLTDAAITYAAQVAKGAAMENARRLEGAATGMDINDSASSRFDPLTDMLVTAERSAPVPATTLTKGVLVATLVSDRIGETAAMWQAVAGGYYKQDATSLDEAHAMLTAQRLNAPDGRCAIGVSVGETIVSNDAHLATVLRMTQCATAGTCVADSGAARAMLSKFPKMRIEPLGELPDAGGAIGIYAIE